MSLHNIAKVLSKSAKGPKAASLAPVEPKRLTKEEYEQAYIDKVLLRPLKKSIQKRSEEKRKPAHKPSKKQAKSLVNYRKIKEQQELKKTAR